MRNLRQSCGIGNDARTRSVRRRVAASENPKRASASKKLKRRRLIPILILLVCASSFVALLRWKSPMELCLPPCLFRQATGLYCPGCGSTRALWRLFCGDLRGSLRFHPLVAPLLPFVVVLVVRFFYDSFNGSSPYRRSTHYFGALCLVLFLTLFILRNVPCATFDFLRPPTVN